MEMRIMSDLGVRNAAAEADAMVNPALLAASMIDERAPDVVEALNDMPPELAVAVLLHLPPDRAIEVLDQPGLEREPELVTLMPREAAAKLLAGVSADRVADIFRQVKEPHCTELLDLLDPEGQHPPPAGIFEGHRGIDRDDRIRQRSLDIHRPADA